MHTFKYKLGYIHENFTSGEVTYQVQSIYGEARSVRAAKVAITRIMNRHQLLNK